MKLIYERLSKYKVAYLSLATTMMQMRSFHVHLSMIIGEVSEVGLLGQRAYIPL